MGILLDAIVIIFLLFFIQAGRKKGGARGILEILSFIVTVIAIMLFKQPITEFLLGLEPVQGWIDALQETFDATLSEQPVVAMSGIADSMARDLISILINAAGFIVTFLVVRVLLRVLMHVIDQIMSLPILRSINKLLGSVVGGLKGCVILWLLLLLLPLFAANDFAATLSSYIADSYLTKLLYNYNPLISLFL